MREEFKDDFKEWQTSRDESEVLIETNEARKKR